VGTTDVEFCGRRTGGSVANCTAIIRSCGTKENEDNEFQIVRTGRMGHKGRHPHLVVVTDTLVDAWIPDTGTRKHASGSRFWRASVVVVQRGVLTREQSEARTTKELFLHPTNASHDASDIWVSSVSPRRGHCLETPRHFRFLVRSIKCPRRAEPFETWPPGDLHDLALGGRGALLMQKRCVILERRTKRGKYGLVTSVRVSKFHVQPCRSASVRVSESPSRNDAWG